MGCVSSSASEAKKEPDSDGTKESRLQPCASERNAVTPPAGIGSKSQLAVLSDSIDLNLRKSGDRSRREPTSSVSGAHHQNQNEHKGPKERRAAAGSEAVRDQIRKLAVGSNNQRNASTDANIYEVSDSEDEGDDDDSLAGGWAKPPEVTDSVCGALRRNFVFKGISDSLLLDVVARMDGVCFSAGSVVLQQGALPKAEDCMYFLESGSVEVVISGAVEQYTTGEPGEERTVEGHTVRILQKPGWVFGDVALLFHSSRTASVVAKDNITVWALERKTFLTFVMKHAQGARALRFLRKLPLLKGLSDNDLIRAASRMPQRVYQDGQALIKYGERGDELFLIRYGKVCVMRPDGNGGRAVAVTLGRGQFIGERAVINNRMRSADCIAQGSVQVVVMKKKDFMDLDNPLLAWMLDYDAVATCLRGLPYLKGLKQEQMEKILDRFDPRQELYQGDAIVTQGSLLEKIFVVKIGEVRLYKNNEPHHEPNFIREVGGFSFFGSDALEKPFTCGFDVVVHTETLQLLTLGKSQLDNFLGHDTALTSLDAVLGALSMSKGLGKLSEAEGKELLAVATETSYKAGDIIISAGLSSSNRVFLIKSGEVALRPPNYTPAADSTGNAIIDMSDLQHLTSGSTFNDEAAFSPTPLPIKDTLIAVIPGTTVISFTAEQVIKVTGGRIKDGLPSEIMLKSVKFSDLEQHRVIGTGQFGMVRLVRNRKTNDVYALKAMFKAPITESKQIEHVLNERLILQQANHPFCVRITGAYQDKTSLYLLQEWVPGGELFHHLDLEGAFNEATASFFAANVLLALEFLHSKNIVYRDLKPENLLVDAQGYLKVADFGFAKHLGDENTFTICGTPDYQAPEVIMRRGTNKAADYWALGVLIFEMLVGDPPFKSLTGDPWDTFRRTLSGRFFVPDFISDPAADLIFKLLQELMTELSDSSTGYRGEVLLLAQVTTLFLIIAPPIQLQGLVNLMGILLLSAGAVYILYSLICLGRNMSPMPAPRKRHKLITSGMYGIVRHPMYGGVLFTALGWAAVTMSETRLALSLILWFVLEMKIKYEEDALSARYAEYADYKMQVKKFIPLVY